VKENVKRQTQELSTMKLLANKSRLHHRWLLQRCLTLLSSLFSFLQLMALPAVVSGQESLEEKRALRKEFQSLEMTTSRYGGWLFAPGLPPKIVWRDAEAAKKFGLMPGFKIRWFNSNLEEAETPVTPGRWIAWLEGVAPNQTPFRRAFTLYALPANNEDQGKLFVPDLTVRLPNFPGANAPPAWKEHQIEFDRISKDFMLKALIDTEQGAILVAGIAESKELGRPKRFPEWTSVVNAQHHLNLKLKLLDADGPAKSKLPLALPQKRSKPALTIRPGSFTDAGVPKNAKQVIDEFCQQWVETTKEPFVTLVAKNGVIITHTSFGTTADGKPIDLNYRCWAASITKTVTAIMFSQFVDQDLIELDWTLDRVFANYPTNSAQVPTFRQLLNHTSGLSGHADWGGMLNPHLENIVLNGIDVNEPGVKHEYSGLGFELAAKAMEIQSGKCAPRVYHDYLFEPLGFGDVILGNASSDGEFTAMELAIIGQWIANRGSYGQLEFVSPQTFAEFLPQKTNVTGTNVDQGLGLHRVSHRRPGAPANSLEPGDQLFSENAVGHGSFSGCILLVDPDQQLVIVQARKQFHKEDNELWSRFFQVAAAAIANDPK
jgi:CubicO group peptidase (beta-lactamase class C family)